jgi:hypothetical protein
VRVDVAGYLRSRGVSFKSAGPRNVHTQCIFCDEPPDKRGRLYINIDPDAEVAGLYMCHICGARGSLTTLKRHFGDKVRDYDLDQQTRNELLSASALYYAAQLNQYSEVITYLKGPERGLHTETLKAHQIGYAPMAVTHDLATNTTTTEWPNRLFRHLRDRGYATADILATGLCQERDHHIVDSLGGMITIPYHVAGNVTAIRGRTWPHTEDDFDAWLGDPYPPFKAKYKTCSGTSTRLFNTDAVWNTDEIYAAEGEMDAMVLEQNGYPAIGVPGADAWQENWDDYLHNLKRVWLVYDRDAAGEKGADKLGARIGPKVRQVHLSEPGVKCDPTMFFAQHTVADFEAILTAARRGGALVTVNEAIDEFDAIQSQPGVKFNWELLDIMINPGLQAGQIMVLLAKTNTGKTLMLLNLLHRVRTVAAQQDFKILFLSLEQTRGEWWDRARRIHRFYNINETAADAADWWKDHILIIDRNRVSEPDLRQHIDDFAYEMGSLPHLLAIDYLGYWARSFRGEAYQRTSDAVMALKALAGEYRIPLIVPHQVSRVGRDGEEFGGDAGRDSGVVEETADFVLTMWKPDNALGREAEERTGKVHLRISKSRHGGRGQLLTMQEGPISLVMVPDGDPLCARARKEIVWKQDYRSSWDEAVFRHRTGIEGHLEPDDFNPPTPPGQPAAIF